MPRILIVDDEPEICECLKDFFQGKGFSVLMAFSGEAALQQLSQQRVEVILLDVKLPGLHGLEVLKRIKQMIPEAKVVMVSGLTYPELRRRARRYGACAYVTKPFDFSEDTWAPVLCETSGYLANY